MSSSTNSFRVVTLLRRLHLSVRAHVVDELRAAGYDDITPAHISVFQTPGPDGVRPTELAERALMTKQAMNHLLAGLEERGYVERVTSADDGRARVVRLTAKGRTLTQFIQQTSAAIERRWATELGAAGLAELRDSLEQLDVIGVGTRGGLSAGAARVP
jgi:DNA-binding MarR family transcriptional regulator